MSLHISISTKRAVAVHGLQSGAFTLYADEWKEIFESTDVILDFIARQHLQLTCQCSEDRRSVIRSMAELCADIRRERGYPARQSLRCTRSIGGKVNVHGVRRFPVGLCCTSWSIALAHRQQIEDFIKANHDRLAWKGSGVPRSGNGSGGSVNSGAPTEIGPDNIRRPKRRTA